MAGVTTDHECSEFVIFSSTPRDDRGRRSGWLSDKPGSLIRFRVDAAGAQLSITYLASFANFGYFRVWAGGKPHSPGAVSIEVDGHRSKFSLPRVARFPSTSELMRALRRAAPSGSRTPGRLVGRRA